MQKILQSLPIALALLAGGCAILDTADETAGPRHPAASERGATPELPAALVPDALVSFETPASLPDPLPPARPDDLWQRIREGFRLPEADDPKVRQQLSYFAARPDYMARVAERARPYLFHIVEQIEARDLPTELALLPVVESAFRPFAYSHGRAAGIWQFVPATGRHYGLTQNWWYDGRRDVLAATDAALDYLERLSELFDGDWLLAVAAYNAGEGRVMRAIERNRAAGRPGDFWSLDLPRETRHYVPRLLALRDLVQAPEVHGLSIPEIPNEPQIATVELDHQIDLALAAELAGITVEQLYQLNPGYNRWATAPEGPHRLVLPLELAEAFRTAVAERPPESWLRWERHRVQPGESLIAIARRYHVTVDALREANDLNGSLIRAGSHLLVPVASRPSGEYALSAGQRLRAQQDRQRAGRERQSYVVRSGDSFWSIARRHGVGVRELAGWNNMAPGDTLRVGQQLAIWTEDAQPVRTARAAPEARLQSVRYTVRKGDSLYAIAQRFNVTVSQLRQWNGLGTGGYLQPGQTLRLRVDVTAQSSR
ncbi:LysM peptidoglycan-binding domain-containing protein [Spiribacter halobius]|uniref:Lytic transglycosylase n=1 Tax=Sediminicurvatus halobius TaxID=2182432 RepID=A0A2U2N6A2_9GAMM|nr:LysM peptidoglycan-binding domain-containing protein [Spiribacter halobius]PWG64597.1 lytic transglycosylase [Spiribacter halobius]UEX79080.1 LysM peptidoglycan-binding domain-containing protein [Spiribacter halobius]